MKKWPNWVKRREDQAGSIENETELVPSEIAVAKDCNENLFVESCNDPIGRADYSNDVELEATMSLDIHEYEPPKPCDNGSAEDPDDNTLPSAYLRLASTDMGDLPLQITVRIGLGGEFSIGRYDALVGKKQSDFEFHKNTRAVSRRHAVIKRLKNGYFITDIGSTAGTYINDAKIPPSRPRVLSNGDRISFGKAGADYIWESSRRGDINE